MVTVPTVDELAINGLAKAVAHGAKGPTHYRLTPTGQALVYAAMTTNAQRVHLRTMRALDPEGPTDMDQDREDRIAQAKRLRPELSVLQCRAVNAETGSRCTGVEGHERVRGSKHDAGVTFETNAAIHARTVGGSTW